MTNKSNVKNYEKAFERIVGYDEVKLELYRICDTLANGEKYKALNVNTPKGLLIEGEPGTGKTTLVNCMIKASGRKAYIVRKYKTNGNFMEEIENAFNKAEENAPSIVFLDDLDKFANEDEDHCDASEYVAVQALIDNVKDKDVFVVATVNEKDKLPNSLIRAGRFDSRIKVEVPIGEDAEKIVEYYLEDKKTVVNVDCRMIAKIMSGSSCAELETVINEAGIYAAYEGKAQIDMDDIIRAVMRVVYEAPEKLNPNLGKVYERIAYHEAGHTVVAEVLGSDKVNLVSIKEHTGGMGGITSIEKPEDYWHSFQAMENRAISILGGKAATEIVFGDHDAGAGHDLDRVGNIVRRFVEESGAFGFYRNNRYEISAFLKKENEDIISAEITKYYQRAKKILIANREFLDKIAKELIEKEVILYTDIEQIKKTCNIVKA